MIIDSPRPDSVNGDEPAVLAVAESGAAILYSDSSELTQGTKVQSYFSNHLDIRGTGLELSSKLFGARSGI